MKYIITLSLETEAPIEAFDEPSNISMEVGLGGMVWKSLVEKLHVFKQEEEEEDGKKALKVFPKALKNISPFNMGMHMGMSNTSGGD